MLLQRILTAIVLATVVIAAIFVLPTLYFYLFIAIIVLIAGWEWTALAEINSLTGKCAFIVCLIIPMLAITFFTQILEIAAEILQILEIKKYSGALEWLVIGPALFWVIMTFLIKKVPNELLKMELKQSHKFFIGWFVLLAAWMFLSRLRAFYQAEAVMYFLALIWIADISAYFAGKKFGKDKLAPVISPGKTRQGMYGAMVSAIICAVSLSLYYEYPAMITVDFALLSVLTVMISIYGDLFFSLVKRRVGVKDSGFILPGHGGLLDRIDSVIAAVPFYYAGFYLITRNIYS